MYGAEVNENQQIDAALWAGFGFWVSEGGIELSLDLSFAEQECI